MPSVERVLDDSARSTLARTRWSPVEWVTEIDSTNTELLRRAGAGARSGAVLVADHQTAGRGRLGRRWESPAGSALLMSALVDQPPAGSAPLTWPLALAAVEACELVAGVRPALKWPNDLFVGERKLAGILAEARSGRVVLGIGLNVSACAGLPETAVSLEEAVSLEQAVSLEPGAAPRAVPGRESLLVSLLVRLDALLDRPGSWLPAYRDACSTLGREVRVELAGEELRGEAVDVLPTGELVLDVGAPGRRIVAAGDVVHLRPR
jgi:BirA family biotin operon repressor/biotin-[acetyl-CoA-carboxylase] ligase